jgi:hypothetical protein
LLVGGTGWQTIQQRLANMSTALLECLKMLLAGEDAVAPLATENEILDGKTTTRPLREHEVNSCRKERHRPRQKVGSAVLAVPFVAMQDLVPYAVLFFVHSDPLPLNTTRPSS